MSTALRSLISSLCRAAAALAQNDAGETLTGATLEFGAPGESGSYRARFSKQTGGIVWLQATDHYV